MEEADIVQPILGLLEHPSENVRTSALGTMSSSCTTPEEARQDLPGARAAPAAARRRRRRVGWSRPEVDAAEAVSVQAHARRRAELAPARDLRAPGVVKSIVDAATQALPPDEEAVLHRLGCSVGQPVDRREVCRAASNDAPWAWAEGRDAAATAVVNVIQADNDGRENGFEPRVDDDVADDDEGDDGDFNRRRRTWPRWRRARNRGRGSPTRTRCPTTATTSCRGSRRCATPAASTPSSTCSRTATGGAAKTPLDTVEEASEEDCVEAPPPVADEAPVEGRCAGELADAGGPAARVHAEPGPRAAQAAVQAAGALVASSATRAGAAAAARRPPTGDRSASRSPSPDSTSRRGRDRTEAARARPGLARQRRARRRARPGPSEAEDDAGAAEEAAEVRGLRRLRPPPLPGARAADDIVVRQGLPAYELGLHSRITSHLSGFRRWHATHELVAIPRRRAWRRASATRAAHRAARAVAPGEGRPVDMIRGATVAGATSGLAQRSDDQRPFNEYGEVGCRKHDGVIRGRVTAKASTKLPVYVNQITIAFEQFSTYNKSIEGHTLAFREWTAPTRRI
ncbi:hypothetical protein JL720_16462 [Aureococcus anophagefferens]|nr:hypothetical protein JL720_16462 [Aureococcus anophagefferens]